MAVNYGRDTWCAGELKTGRTVTGPALLGQAAYNRLTTPNGALRILGGEEESIYGLDISGHIGRDPRNVEASLPGKIRAELLKDERFADVSTVITKTVTGPATAFRIRISITPSAGPTFTLVLAADEVTTQLLGIEATS